MRLINVRTYWLEEFYGHQIPLYAILSHRWDKGEVLFQDMQTQHRREKKGWTKIAKCCELAQSHGWDYVWIDTCCIDKSSSSELSEAINSMFEWYANAGVCYVYLSDYSESSYRGKVLGSSKWFRRGWTLQELLAPTNMLFLDRDWSPIGNKQSLSSLIAGATGISKEHLFNFSTASVAQKMSWASRRTTTRIEDEAYSLLGLFGVHMPLLYGEGNNAFLRLQLEILKTNDDVSILAWTGPDTGNVLAESVADFWNARCVTPREDPSHQVSLHMTSRGLVAEVVLHTAVNGEHFVPLEVEDSQEQSSLALGLEAISDGRFRRSTLLYSWNHHVETALLEASSICIDQSLKRRFGDSLLFHVVIGSNTALQSPVALSGVRHLQIKPRVPTRADQTNQHVSAAKSKTRQCADIGAGQVSLRLGETCLFHLETSKLVRSGLCSAAYLSELELYSTPCEHWPKLCFALYAVGKLPCFKVWPWSPTSDQEMIENLASTTHLKPPLLEGAMIRMEALVGISSWLMIRFEPQIHRNREPVKLCLHHEVIEDRALPQDVDCEVRRYGEVEVRYFHLPKPGPITISARDPTWFSRHRPKRSLPRDTSSESE